MPDKDFWNLPVFEEHDLKPYPSNRDVDQHPGHVEEHPGAEVQTRVVAVISWKVRNHTELNGRGKSREMR